MFIGAEVQPGDILVGKVTPKGETELSSEEKLLRAIFGEKAGDVRDASLKVPPGAGGIVIDIKTFSRKERGQKSDREDKSRIQQAEALSQREREALWAEFDERLTKVLRTSTRKSSTSRPVKRRNEAGREARRRGAIAYVRHA